MKVIFLNIIFILFISACGVSQADKPSFSLSAKEIFTDTAVLNLALAAGKGNIKDVKQYIQSGINPNWMGKYKLTPLFWALREHNIAGFKALLKNGANPNIIIRSGSSVMHLVSRLKNSEYLRLCIQYGGDVDLMDTKTNETPLFMAVSPDGKQNIAILLEEGANIDHLDKTRSSAIFRAASLNQYDAVHNLLVKGANYNIKNVWNNTFIFYIENNRINKSSELYQWRKKVINFLIAKGVEINLKK